ncbi:MAG: DUF885 domain-containing protein, partial [Brevundimonas sp.]
MIDRRHLLMGAAGTVALTALPAAASTDRDTALDALMAGWFAADLDRNPENATNLGLDRGPNADRASRL